MGKIYIGSARHDENGNLVGGKNGDQLQGSHKSGYIGNDDHDGEVSIQEFYKHSKGWYILRPIIPTYAKRLAEAMTIACNNKNIGYNQNNRLGVVSKGIQTDETTACDCSSLIRACIKAVYGIDVGNFTTANECTILEQSCLFYKPFKFVNLTDTPIYDGDVLVTISKGHTVIVISGNPRVTSTINYYPKYTGTSTSIVDALKSVGEKDTTIDHRKKIAVANRIATSNNTAMNTSLLVLLKQGKLIKA